MTHAISPAPRHRAAFARPERKAPDVRWQLLDDLTAARDNVGLKDRTLQVLRALLSFLPAGMPGSLVVFPSNRTLGERLLGMPESTLRRHLRILCEIGLLARRNSPNRKRYRVGQSADLTFGLDLTPFFGAAVRLRDLAREARAAQAARKELRARILLRLAHLGPDHPVQIETRAALRRKNGHSALESLLAQLPAAPEPAEMIADDGENERHKQPDDRLRTSDIENAINALGDIGDLTGTQVRTPTEIDEAGRLASLAIGAHTAWTLARHRHGAAWAALAVAHVHRARFRIRDPDRYLLSLSRRAVEGTFDLMAALARFRPGSAPPGLYLGCKGMIRRVCA